MLVVTQKATDTMQSAKGERDEAVATYVNTFILLRWLSEPQTVPTPLCFKCFCGVFCKERADVLKSFLPISAQPFGTLYINYSWDLAQKTVLHFSVPHEYITNRRGGEKKLLRENCSNVWTSTNGTRICVNETKSLLHNVLVRKTRRGFFPSFLLSGASRPADRALRQYQPYAQRTPSIPWITTSSKISHELFMGGFEREAATVLPTAIIEYPND